MHKISNLNDLKNGPVIEILYENMKKLALFVFYTIFSSVFKLLKSGPRSWIFLSFQALK